MMIWRSGSGLFMTRVALLSAAVILFLSLANGNRPDASAATSGPPPARVSEVMVYAAADESSQLIENVRDGAVLSPMLEMIGAGGEKWFMVKTRSGNVGWIKADETSGVKKIDDHFRSLPKDSVTFGPVNNAPEAAQTSATGSVKIPIRLIGNAVVVPVTITSGNSSMTGNLLVDTGASQTVLSKRIASGLRLFAHDTQSRYGIGGAVRADVSVVDSIQVGAAAARNVRVTIHDFSPDPRFEGLLGLDFLGRFQMSVDTAKRVMILTPHQR